MSDPTATPSPDLAPLTADYDVVGELGSSTSTRFLLATAKTGSGNRRDDDRRVAIEIVPQPEGDEAHALQHLASDVTMLRGLRHRRLVPTIEGRWLGADAFAVVRERVDDPTLAERLAQGETFTNTRTAAILREVHGLMEWAREQNIVHRGVTPDRLYLEPETDRVRVAFAASPIPRIRTSEPETDDALAIVRLAVTMMSGNAELAQTGEYSLAVLRPDLPDRLIEETAALLGDPKPGIDVPQYLALIGMADPVAEGESERDRIRAEVLEEQRVEREKLANERAAFEEEKAEERRTLAAEGEELRRVFAAEKADLEREFTEAQEALAAERVRMQRILSEERGALAAKQQDLEREVAARMMALERAASADRASIEELRARIRVAGELEIERKRAKALEELDDAEMRLETGELATPAFMRPYIASLDKLTFRDNDPLAPESVRRSPKAPDASRLEEVVEDLKAPRRKPVAWSRWFIPSAIAAAAILAAASVVIIKNRPASVAAAQRGAPATRTTTAGAMAPVVRRAAPTVAPPAALSAAEMAKGQQWLDSIRAANPMDMEWALLQSEAVERKFARARVAAQQRAAFRRDSLARAAGDSSGGGQSRDTVPARDSSVAPDGR